MYHKSSIILNTLFAFILIIPVSAISFADSLKLPVTFFDFHSTGVCPDFNPADGKTVIANLMVKPVLDRDSLPVAGIKMYFSFGIGNWFRNWSDQTLKNVFPVYKKFPPSDTNPNHGTLSELRVVPWDTVYKNIVIDDSISLKRISNGYYAFRDTAFFPIDGQGFGNEPALLSDGSQTVSNHNYSFTMKFVTLSRYLQGNNQKVRWGSSGDMWVFINNRMISDLGGIHGYTADSITMDEIATKIGIRNREIFTISYFYAQRQAVGSDILISAPSRLVILDGFKVILEPKEDTIRPLETATKYGRVLVDTGFVTLAAGDLVWGFADLQGQNSDSCFSVIGSKQEYARFTPRQGPDRVRIWCKYTNQEIWPGTGFDTAFVTVIPTNSILGKTPSYTGRITVAVHVRQASTGTIIALSFGKPVRWFEATLYSLDGKKITSHSTTTTTQDKKFTVKGLCPGIYLIHIRSDAGMEFQKMSFGRN